MNIRQEISAFFREVFFSGPELKKVLDLKAKDTKPIKISKPEPVKPVIIKK